jgi:hypothetical protein
MTDLFEQVAQPLLHCKPPAYAHKRCVNVCPNCGGPKGFSNPQCQACRIKKHRPPELAEVFIVEGERCRKLPLTKKMYGLIPEDRYDDAMLFRWHVYSDDKNRRTYAATIGAKNSRTTLHEFIAGYSPCDHINGDGLDNRRGNLRPCDASTNGGNSQLSLRNTTGFKGVKEDKRRNSFCSRIVYQYAEYHLGSFKTKEEAARRYDLAAVYFFKEYARLNFPEERAQRVLEAVLFSITPRPPRRPALTAATGIYIVGSTESHTK